MRPLVFRRPPERKWPHPYQPVVRCNICDCAWRAPCLQRERSEARKSPCERKQLSTSKRGKFEHWFSNPVSSIFDAEDLCAGVERWDDEYTFVISIGKRISSWSANSPSQRCKLFSNLSVFNGFGLADSNSCCDAEGTVNCHKEYHHPYIEQRSLDIWLAIQIQAWPTWNLLDNEL